MLNLEWQREREREREREEGGLAHQGKLRQGKIWRSFLRFRHFFPMKCFPDQNHIPPTKKTLCR